MSTLKLNIELKLDGDPDRDYAQQIVLNIADALKRQADQAGLSPEDGPCIEHIRVNTLSDAVSGQHFRIAPVERNL